VLIFTHILYRLYVILADCFIWFTWTALSVGSMKSPIIDYWYVPLGRPFATMIG